MRQLVSESQKSACHQTFLLIFPVSATTCSRERSILQRLQYGSLPLVYRVDLSLESLVMGSFHAQRGPPFALSVHRRFLTFPYAGGVAVSLISAIDKDS